jgi:hypothetical protein
MRRGAVFIHDPQAHKPRNLDDPFIDPKAQERVGQWIARASSAQNTKI